MCRMRILRVAVLGLGLLWGAPPPRKISFARAGGVVPGTLQMFISASDGSDEHPLLAEPHDDYDAVWAPDGQSIVFTSDRNGSGDLFRVDADGTADAAYVRCRIRRSGGVLSRWQATCVCEHPGQRLCGYLDARYRYEAREGAYNRARGRLPPCVVARRQLHRLLFRARHHGAFRRRPLGAAATGRDLPDSP